MTVLVDMDDVLVNSTEVWVECLNRRFGMHVRYEDLDDFDVSAAFYPRTHAEVYAMQADADMWRMSRPLPGAPEALASLIARGHRVIVVTSSRYTALETKMEDVLFRYFPFLTWNDVIVTAEKQRVRGDVLIDDGPHNFQGGEYRGILFTAPHNRAFNAEKAGLRRADTWQDVLTLLETTE
jgi:5'(3')-deoxyribonucleotidase